MGSDTVPMRISNQSIGLIGLMGGLGGAINAWLCYVHFPMSKIAAKDFLEFSWWIVPAGAGHGALLAILIVGRAVAFVERSSWARWLMLPIVGWFSGVLSWFPIGVYLGGAKPDSIGMLFLPFLNLIQFSPPSAEVFWRPFQYFGAVGAVYFFLLAVCRQLRTLNLRVHVVIGGLSGILGSLWWWTAMKLWYFSLLHGAIWGSLVGFGVWKSQLVVRDRH